jgi:hypothetical protein
LEGITESDIAPEIEFEIQAQPSASQNNSTRKTIAQFPEKSRRAQRLHGSFNYLSEALSHTSWDRSPQKARSIHSIAGIEDEVKTGRRVLPVPVECRLTHDPLVNRLIPPTPTGIPKSQFFNPSMMRELR